MSVQQNVLTAQQVRTKNILRSAYAWMALGLLCTGIVAWMGATSPAIQGFIARSPFVLLMLVLVEFGLVFYLSARIMNMSAQRATSVFILYSALNGLTLSVIFLAYTATSIYQAFFVSAGAFAGMSVYAMVTKRDLTGLGKYFMMGLWGLIILSVIGIFFQSSQFQMMISVIGLILFMGLTAYDTQIIMQWSNEYSGTVDDTNYRRIAIIGALKLYLDFINIFLFMLRLLGSRRN